MLKLNKTVLEDAINEFEVTPELFSETARKFDEEIKIGLSDPSKSSLKMLPSFLTLPNGDEAGTYLALDFGGTNVRVLKIKISNRNYEILKKAAKPLKIENKYDYIGKDATGENLFDFIAELIEEVLEGDKNEILLGHTFSFPSEQLDLENAKLISWTKEFQTRGVEGENVTELLKNALARKNLQNVRPVAIINDTVATLLTAAFIHKNTRIGSIYATGHNTCYFEENYNKGAMILNLESGGFSKVKQNAYDKILDKESEKPGEQFLEKQVSGRYVGELYALVLKNALKSEKNFCFTSLDLCNISQNKEVKNVIKSKTNFDIKNNDEEKLFVNLAKNILTRSASLAASTFLGIFKHMGKPSAIAIDGSFYAKNPFLQDIIKENLKKTGDIKIFQPEDASALGAAIAAAVAEK